jgi:protein-disulfide isomerase
VNRFWSILEKVVTVASVVVIGLIAWQRFGPPKRKQQTESIAGRKVRVSLSHRLGTGNVALIEFADFQCPFCEKFHTAVFPEVKRTLIDTGIVTFVHMNFPLAVHQLAIPAANVAECAEKQGRYWATHDLLFVSVKEGSFSTTYVGSKLGLDANTLESCVRARPQVNENEALGKRLHLTGTPTFMVGRFMPDGDVSLSAKINGVPTMETITRVVALAAKPQV